ncbi:hypothetical protein, partial [Streptomyces sp. UNOC14_S4]|uniref:hypothetical protein n=1 Tax=Streptomyces sp. UNOC14_S4 TaxID=2872340 RepID=UPI001EE5CD02
ETTSGSVIAHVEGSRDEALRELEKRAWSYEPVHPYNPRRRRLFRTADGYALILDGAWDDYVTHFTVAELLYDSDTPPPEPQQDDRPVEAVPKKSLRRKRVRTEQSAARPETAAQRLPQDARDAARYDADGVPLKPSWLGRGDLP